MRTLEEMVDYVLATPDPKPDALYEEIYRWSGEMTATSIIDAAAIYSLSRYVDGVRLSRMTWAAAHGDSNPFSARCTAEFAAINRSSETNALMLEARERMRTLLIAKGIPVSE